MENNIFLESDFLSKKRILVFGVNRMQSDPTLKHVKQIDKLYDNIISHNIDEIYCISFNDFLLFDFFAPKLSKKIKFYQLSDTSNLESFKKVIGKKGHPEFLRQYWQFGCVLKDGIVEHYIEQTFSKKIIPVDTKQNIYSWVSPEIILEKIKNNV